MKLKIYSYILFIVLLILLFSNFSNPSDNTPHLIDFKYPERFGTPNIPADNPLTEEGVWLGRLLFYDSILSIDRTMSCASCHKQELSFTDGRTLSIGVHGDTLTRNAMSLVNLSWSKYFFWNGRVLNLEEVIKEPISKQKEMGGLSEDELVKRLEADPHYPLLFKKAFPNEKISIITVSKSIAQFIRTITSNLNEIPELHKNSKDFGSPIFFDNVLKEESMRGLIARGSVMPCKGCHNTIGFGGQMLTTFTSDFNSDNDTAFKAVSLMNVRFTAPYMHDGRFKTMRQVLQFYNDSTESILAKNPQVMKELSPVVKKYLKIVKFTKYDLDHADQLFDGFEDSTILTNPSLANPFEQSGFNWAGMKK